MPQTPAATSVALAGAQKCAAAFGLSMPLASHDEPGSEVPQDGVSATKSPQARPRAAHVCASLAAPERRKKGP